MSWTTTRKAFYFNLVQMRNARARLSCGKSVRPLICKLCKYAAFKASVVSNPRSVVNAWENFSVPLFDRLDDSGKVA